MLCFTCIIISSVDLACYGVYGAEDLAMWVVVVVLLLFYVHSKYQWSCWD